MGQNMDLIIRLIPPMIILMGGILIGVILMEVVTPMKGIPTMNMRILTSIIRRITIRGFGESLKMRN
jgi:hypothetical protein